MTPTSKKSNLTPMFIKSLFPIILIISCYGCAAGSKVALSIPEQRAKAVDAYLDEFSTQSFKESKIGPAIRAVMMRMPADALKIMMNRRRPVLFVEVYSSGTARFASSSEVMVTAKDKLAFQEGMTLIRISDALAGGSSEAIMGIVAHEIAHRVLDHIRQNHVSCQAEKEANRLIKSWGFTKEFEAASQEFGQAKEGQNIAGCKETLVTE